MKTYLKRWKYFAGLGLAGLMVFSTLLNYTAPAQQQTAYAACAPADAPSGTNCADIRIGCPGSTQQGPGNFTPGSTYTCPYPPLPGSNWTCPAQLDRCTFNNGAPSIPGGQGPGAQPTTPVQTTNSCPPASLPAGTQIRCDQIPAGCPGSTLQGPLAPNTDINCPYTAVAGSAWRCIARTCSFGGGNTVSNGQPAPSPAAVNGTGDDLAGSSTGCDADLLGNPLTWVICPIVGMLEQGIRLIDRFIMSSLEFDTDTVFHNQPGYKIAWNSFRAMATAILLIAGLIMVASTALGFEFLDAYTVKKSLPKILIAALFINISWFAMEFAIDFFNAFGRDIREIIYSPFNTAEFRGVLTGETIFTFFMGAGGALVFLGAGALLSFLATAVLAVLVGFLIIIVRNLALIVLIIFAPVAIACWVLPNTTKIWNLWKDNFIGLLLVFPIISAFIAIGRVFSAVSLNSSGGTQTMGSTTAGQIIGFVAYFLPYFLLPIAFRLATGIIGTVAGFVNDTNKGAFDRLKKYRGNKMAQNTAALKAGSRYNPDSRATKLLGGRVINRAGSHAGAGVRGRFGVGAVGAQARANNAYATSDQLAKESQAFGAQVNNEEAMVAVAMGNDRRKLASLSHFQRQMTDDNGNVLRDSDGNIRTELDEDRLNGALAAGRSVGSNQRTQVAALDALAKSGKIIRSRDELNTVLDSASHGNAALKGGLKGQYQYTSRQVGRNDIGRDSAVETVRELDMSSVGRMKPLAAANVFGTDENGNSQWHEAVYQSGSPEERQHMYDVLYAAQHNPYMAPEQYASVQRTIQSLDQTDPFWTQAGENYSAKMIGSNSSRTPGATSGGAPGLNS